jgi:hypothetical protein
MLEVVKEEVSASITIPAYAIANISVSPNMHLIIRRQNIDPNALILTGMQIYYSQNSTKISDSIQPLSNLPAYIMHTDITAPVNIEGTIPITGTVSLEAGTTVNIASMPNVTIAGTPTVNIGSGSITVNSGNINIANAPDVNVQSTAPQPGQGYCATITAYVGSAYNSITEVMFMAKNPLQPASQLPASEFTKSSRITGFMIAMPKSWINGVSSNVTVTVDFYQRKDTNTPTYAIYTETLGFYYNSSGVTVNPVVYRQIDTPFMANCAIVTVHGTNTTPYYMTYQLAVDAITNNNRIRINGRQGLGVSDCGIIKFEKQFTATGGFSNTIFICPSARYTHLTYAEDELDMNGTVRAMDVSVYDTTGTFRGRIMRQRSPSLLKPTDYNLDIWLPPSYTIKSNVTVTTSGIRRLLYIYYELWDIDEPSDFTF